MKCFYHNDADGKCAAYWVKYYLGRIQAIDFIAMDYTKPFPLNTIQPGETIYIVDFSIHPKIMDELLKITKDVTWIDHHKTAIQMYLKECPHCICGLRHEGIAACMLTYCYLAYGLYGNQLAPRTKTDNQPIYMNFETWMMDTAPLFTKLIADWDTWSFKYGDVTRQFMVMFNSGDFDPNGKDWQDTPTLPTESMIQDGKKVIDFLNGWAKEYLGLGFETIFHGYKCFALNLGRCNSEYFKSLPEDKYDIYIAFVFNGVSFSVSLYSTTVDVSKIAQIYDGGGHTGAAGFVSDSLPFSKLK